MAGSIKIQHGATASTPQAGFSTLWASSADGEFYYTKPNGVSESLIGPTGPQGPIGPLGLGLNAKNIGVTGGQFTYIPGGITGQWPVSNYSYVDIVFDAPFASTNYSVDFQYSAGDPTDYWSDFFGYFPFIIIGNKTASGFKLVLNQIDIGTEPNLIGYIQAIALGEATVSYYGNFLSTVTQPNAGATAANAITYNTTDLSSGVSVVSNSRITIANAGIYNIEFSAQLQKTSGGDDYVDLWLSKNGTNVANTNTTLHLVSNPGYAVAAWNFLVNAAAGDYYELKWHSADTTMELHAAAAGTSPTRPAIPSVILSVTQVSTA